MYIEEMAELNRRIALGKSLNALLNFNPDFKTVVLEGFLHNAVMAHSLNINTDKAGTIAFLKAVAVFKKYLDQVKAEAEQAQKDLPDYQQLL